MRYLGFIALCIFVALPAGAQDALTADAILKKMDQNLVSDKRTATIEMTVVNRGAHTHLCDGKFFPRRNRVGHQIHQTGP